MIPLSRAMLCENCAIISAPVNDTCPGCQATGCLLSLARVLNPSPELGQINFIVRGKFFGETVPLHKL